MGGARGKWHCWSATSQDQEALIHVEGHAFGTRSWGAQSMRDSFSMPGVFVLLVGLNQESPVGFAIWRDLGGEAEILSIGMLPEHRRSGGGVSLLASVISEAKLKNAARLFLEVDAENGAALALYQVAGFTEIGKRKAYYRDGADALVMEMLL